MVDPPNTLLICIGFLHKEKIKKNKKIRLEYE